MYQVTKFRPFPTTKAMTNGLLDEFFNRNLGDFIGSDGVVSQPAVNILESKEDFQLQVAAPGYSKDDFEVKIEKNLLTLTGKREQKTEETVHNFTRREFRYDSFKRSFNLPETVNQEAVLAKYENGILTLVLPKREEAKPQVKTIQVG